MKIVSKILAGGAAIAMLASAAPAVAQSYPGGSVLGQILGQVLGGGRYSGYGNNGYDNNTQVAVQQCARAVEQRLNGSYGSAYGGNSSNGGYTNRGYPNGGYSNGGYPNGGYNGGNDRYGEYNGGGRVLGITHADRHGGGIFKVKGVASSGTSAGNRGYGYDLQRGDLRFSCEVDYRGNIHKLDFKRNNDAQGYRGY